MLNVKSSRFKVQGSMLKAEGSKEKLKIKGHGLWVIGYRLKGEGRSQSIRCPPVKPLQR
jgi:hypothetical protein